MHPFDEALRLEPLGDGRHAGRTSATYGNMVGPFGGLTNALMLQAVMLHPARIGEPIALTVNFAAPVADGEFEIVARPVRTNRSTQHWSVEMLQQGEVTTTATAVFAQRRPGWSDTEAAMPSGLPEAASVPRQTPAGLPAWFGRYDLRVVAGGLPSTPGAGQPDSVSQVWVRDEPPRALDFQSLAAICDVFYPRAFVRLGRFLPAGTVSMTTYFHTDGEMLREAGEGFLLGVARGLGFRNGYFDQVAEIWSPQRHLLATSTQVVYFRA
jgi:acyl-CoA thioesterase